MSSRAIRSLSIALLAVIYLVGSYIYGVRHNRNFVDTDQNAYLNEIRELRDTDYSLITQRSRMPVYLYLQSIVARAGMSSEALFPRAKIVNWVISVLGLLVVYAIAARALPRVFAENLVLIGAFTVFAFRAAYVYAELLYFTLFFIAFVLMLRLFFRPHFLMAAVTGVVLAVAHLTKASTLPAVGLFIAIYLATALRKPSERFLRAAAICGVLLITYLATLSPYLVNSKRAFGHYFYNVNTTLYVWCDSWLEVCNGPKGHDDRRHWPSMPADQVPSFSKYIHDHGLIHIAEMTVIGAEKLFAEAVNSTGFTKYFVLYCLFAGWLIVANRAAIREWLRDPGRAGAATYLLASCGVYFLAICFYMKITQPGMRFMLALFLPAMFGISWLISREPMKSAFIRIGALRITPELFQWFIRWMLIANILVSIVPRLLSRPSRYVLTHPQPAVPSQPAS